MHFYQDSPCSINTCMLSRFWISLFLFFLPSRFMCSYASLAWLDAVVFLCCPPLVFTLLVACLPAFFFAPALPPSCLCVLTLSAFRHLRACLQLALFGLYSLPHVCLTALTALMSATLPSRFGLSVLSALLLLFCLRFFLFPSLSLCCSALACLHLDFTCLRACYMLLLVLSTLPCPPLPCLALPCLALPCSALLCLALPCPALLCPALPCPALPCSYMLVLCAFIALFPLVFDLLICLHPSFIECYCSLAIE